MTKKDFIIAGLIIIYSLHVLNIYLNKGIPIIDSAIFQYVAQMMLTQGAVPYRDIFDHKPPLIYLINIVGFSISNLAPWGVWLMEFLSLGISIVLSFFLLNKIFGKIPAILGTFFWLLSFFPLIQGGNLTEEYVIPLQFAGILVFYHSEKNLQRIRFSFLLGILFALTLLLRQNLVAIFIGVFIYKLFNSIFKKDFEYFNKFLLYFLLGIVSISVPLLIYLLINQALDDFINYAFVFNYYYSGGGGVFRNFANVTYFGFKSLSSTFIWIISLIAFFDLSVYLIYKLSRIYLKDKRIILWLLLITFPIELLFTSTSGRLATHYYLSWLPIMSLLTAYFIFVLQSVQKKVKFARLTKIIFIIFVIFLLFKILTIPQEGKTYLFNFTFPEAKVVAYIKQNTTKDELIFVWGVGQHINVASNRFSPTKYVFQTPLYTPGFQTPSMYDELLNELKQKRPMLIIDGNTDKTRFKPINCENPNYQYEYLENFKPLPQIHKITEYICKNYKLAPETFEGFRVYSLY